MKDKIKTILIIIIFSLILAVSLVMIFDRKDTEDRDLITIENENVNINSTTNTYDENVTYVNEIEATNIISENATSNVIGREEKESEEDDDLSVNNDQKAIELVKKEWGDGESSVYYNIENKNGTKYTITVRSSETTEAIAWYDVDVEKEKVTSE